MNKLFVKHGYKYVSKITLMNKKELFNCYDKILVDD